MNDTSPMTLAMKATGNAHLIEPMRLVAAEYKAGGVAAVMEAIRANSGPAVEAFDFQGLQWCLARLSYQQTREVGDRTARDGNGSLELSDPIVFHAFLKTVLAMGVVKDETDLSPLFSSEELEEFICDPACAETVAALFDRLTDMNPMAWPTKKDALELGEKILRGEIDVTPFKEEDADAKQSD